MNTALFCLLLAAAPWAEPDAQRGDDEYRSGSSQLDHRRWEKAIADFDEALRHKTSRADGALYWKAYSLNKLGRREESLAVLGELTKNYPSSRWLNDAKVLEVEVRQSSGQPVSPEEQHNEDIKLFALHGIASSDPERAVPLIEKLLESSSSPKLKQRALFVLAQTRTGRAQEVVSRIAFGGSNPDLQRDAVMFIAETKNTEAIRKLAGLYPTADRDLKQAILWAWSQSKSQDLLLDVAGTETDKSLRRIVLHYVGSAGGQDELWKLYADGSEERKLEVLRALHSRASAEKTLDVLRRETNPKLKAELVPLLRRHSTPPVREALAALYQSDSDKKVKTAVIDAIAQQKDSAKTLVEMARAEKDLEMKRTLVHYLSRSKSKEASDYMLELLK